MKKNKDFTTLAILAAAAIAIYFATRTKQVATPPPAATSGLLRRPLHDVA